jgi:pimeloyl-ACP methyl ester carboxylesterase
LNLELHEGLKRLGERGPFVLVGHSFGGAVVRNYAAVYPDEVAGMVLVDSPQEDQRIPMGPHAGRVRDFARGRAIPPARLELKAGEQGAKRAGAPASTEALDAAHRKLPAEDQAVDLWARALPSLREAEESQKEWSSESLALMHRAPQKGILGAMPLLVLTRARGGYEEGLDVPAVELEAERLATQRLLAELSSNSEQRIVDSGHQMHLEAPEVVVAGVERVVVAVRVKGAVR